MFVTAFTEILTIGSIIPFVAGIINPERLYEIPQLKSFLLYANITPDEVSYYSLIFFLSAVILVTVTNLLFLYTNIKFSQKCARFLADKIFKNYLNEDYEKILSKNSAHFLSSIIQKNDSVVSIIQQFLLLIINIIILSFIGIVLFLYSPKFTLYVIIIFIFSYLILSLVSKSVLKKYSILTASLITKRTQILSETFRGFRQVILDNSKKIFQFIFQNTDKKFRVIEAKTSFLANSPRHLFEGMGMIIIALVAVYLKHQNIFTNSDLITYLALLAISAQRALPRINQAYTSWTNISATRQNLIDVNELAFKRIEEKKFIYDKDFNFTDKIQFKNVSFSYLNNEKKILQNLNFTISKGEKIIIRGDSGSGKSTFLDLFLGLLKPTSGIIEIDGQKLSSINIVNYQSIVSSVAQTPAFIDSSISENIVFHISNDADNQKLYKSTKRAEVYDFIMNLDDKFETTMGENGLQLSGGQRQRISIARALYREHKILVCDEATNSLDSETESKVINNLIERGKNITIIFVTHNKNITNKFDSIYTISDGELIKN